MGKIKRKAENLKGILKNRGWKETCLISVGKLFYYVVEHTWICILNRLHFKIRDNRVVFESSVDFSDNARALYEYMVSRNYNKSYEIIWLVNNPKHCEKYGIENVRFIQKKHPVSGCRRWRSYVSVWTAKYIFYTHSMKGIAKKSEEQLFINLWHGCGYKAAKGGSEEMFFDYCLVPGELFVDTKAEFFQCDRKKILPLGYPRYDWMLTDSLRDESIWEKICNADGKFEKRILWMPTFRTSESTQLSEATLEGNLDLPLLREEAELHHLDKICNENKVMLIIKRHHLQKRYAIQEKEYQNIYFLDDEVLEENGVLLYKMLRYTDALITDYSSIAIDYLLLDKPIGFTLDDYERYRASRGFVFEDPLKYMPGRHLYTRESLEEFIGEIAVGTDEYSQRRKEVLFEAHGKIENNYCKKILNYFKI